MKSTKERIVEHLLKFPRSSINDLAEAIGINAISVRHHLTNLKSDGIIEAEEERHGVGRPRLVYFLTEKGLESFPTCYLRLTNLLIEQLKNILSEKQLRNLFSEIANKLSHDYVERASGLPLLDRLPIMMELLVEQGFLVDWEKQDNIYLIREMTCPFQQISQYLPEICKIDITLISSVLGVPEDKIICMEDKTSYRTYKIYEADAVTK
ncbi:MAG: winged helix-turn-helix transcriptional regulator [Anaerolineaceae bacterium]|nr:winged helix-turn-helix transcriptional regulator [Anaerolineaceae bacterium]